MLFKDLPNSELAKAKRDLLNGKPLYGQTEDDVSHIEFALGGVISGLFEADLSDGSVAAVSVLIARDEKGLFIVFSVPDQPLEQ